MAEKKPNYKPLQPGKITVVVGSQWGDEGKGKVIDLLSKDAEVIARYNGGSNAGHTIVVGKEKFAFHLVPSGILYDTAECIVGNGVVMNIPALFTELKMLDSKGINWKGRLKISDRAHLLFELHKMVDGLTEDEAADSKIGTTKQGIGPCYSTKASRKGIRVGDLLFFDKKFVGQYKELVKDCTSRWPNLKIDVEKDIAQYKEYASTCADLIIDSVSHLDKVYKEGKRILVEGANATMLDLDFGTYPYVTSSSPTIGGASTGLGIAPHRIGCIIGIVKAYSTRVGEGPFATENKEAPGIQMLNVGKEYGTTTGRARRCGWLDMVQLRYSDVINGFTCSAILKLDVLSGLKELKIAVDYKYHGKSLPSFPASLEVLEKVEVVYETYPGWDEDITGVRKFEDLPANARKYILRIEELMGVPVAWIGVGPARDAIILRNVW